jgi:FkbM family methyltransferase
METALTSSTTDESVSKDGSSHGQPKEPERISTTPFFRTYSNDHCVWSSVNDYNEYRMPERMDGWTVVDIGAHIGSFSWLAVNRGAAHVIAMEPHPYNYSALLKNIEGLQGRVQPMQMAAWRSDRDIEWLSMINPWEHDHAAGGGFNTGGVSVMCRDLGAGIIRVLGVPLNVILRDYESVDVLKIDCEASEFPILLTCTELHRCKRIVGEYHENIPDYEYGRVNGIKHYNYGHIERRLTEVGFNVEIPNPGPMGLFYATRQ